MVRVSTYARNESFSILSDILRTSEWLKGELKLQIDLFREGSGQASIGLPADQRCVLSYRECFGAIISKQPYVTGTKHSGLLLCWSSPDERGGRPRWYLYARQL